MTKVRAVTAYVDLGLTKRPSAEFHHLGGALIDACGGRIHVEKPEFNECWLNFENPPWKAANPRAEDRFATDDEHIRSNIVQHSPLQWVTRAAVLDPSVEVWVWLGYSLLKQGEWRGNPIKPHHVTEFLDRLEKWTPDCIPFPGIEPRKPVNPTGDNWRFVGSTLILPTKYLSSIFRSYVFHTRNFLWHHKAVPLDLAIWPAVEANSGLPFRFYQAEYDASQLTGFSCS